LLLLPQRGPAGLPAAIPAAGGGPGPAEQVREREGEGEKQRKGEEVDR